MINALPFLRKHIKRKAVMDIYLRKTKIFICCFMMIVMWSSMGAVQAHAGEAGYPGTVSKINFRPFTSTTVGNQGQFKLLIKENGPELQEQCYQYVKENIKITSSDLEIFDPSKPNAIIDTKMESTSSAYCYVYFYFIPQKAGELTLTLSLPDDGWEKSQRTTIKDTATLSSKNISLSLGEEHQLTLKVPGNPTGEGTTWLTGDSSIAAVDGNGLVKGIATGKTTITAQNGAYQDTCNVTVSQNGFYTDGGPWAGGTWIDPNQGISWTAKENETMTLQYYDKGKEVSRLWTSWFTTTNSAVVQVNADASPVELTAKADGTIMLYFSDGNSYQTEFPITITGTGVSPDQTKGLRPITEHQGSTYVELLGFNAQNQSYNQVYYENHLNNYVDLKKLAFSFKVASEKPGGANQLEEEQFPQYEELILSHVNLYEAEGTTLGKKVASWKDGYELQDDPKYGYVAGFEDRGYGQVDMTIVPEAGLLEHDKSYALVFDEEVYAPHKPTSVKKRDKQTIYFFTTKSFVNAASVSLDQSKVSLNQGDTVKLTGTVEPEDSDQTELEWTSSDPAVATVDEQGTVTAVKAGSAMITVKVKETELTGQCQVTVKEKAQTPGTKPTGPTTPPVDTNALDAVKTVKAQANKPNQAAISWEPVSGASGYELWRAESQDGKYERLCAKAAVTYADKGLKSKKTYYYKVRAFQTLEGKTLYSDFSKAVSVKITAKTPVLKAKTGKRQISLSWSKISDADKYELRRSDSKNGVYRKISDKTKNSYVDKGLRSKVKYNYKVRAYRTEKGRKIYGPYSKVLTAKAQPEKIAKLTAKAEKKKVKLSWSKVSGADRYELWRADKKDGPYYKVRVTIKQNWTDTKVKAKKTYYYKARAYYLEKGKKIYGNYTPVKKVRTK